MEAATKLNEKYLEDVGKSANAALFYVENLPPTVNAEKTFVALLDRWWDFLDVQAANSMKRLSDNKELARAREELGAVLKQFQRLHLFTLLPKKKKESIYKDILETESFVKLRTAAPKVPMDRI